jgi:hypothetical protein
LPQLEIRAGSAVSGSYDKTLHVWSLEMGECLALLRSALPFLSIACAAPSRIVAGTSTGEVAIYHLVNFDPSPDCNRDQAESVSGQDSRTSGE